MEIGSIYSAKLRLGYDLQELHKQGQIIVPDLSLLFSNHPSKQLYMAGANSHLNSQHTLYTQMLRLSLKNCVNIRLEDALSTNGSSSTAHKEMCSKQGGGSSELF